jgi:hypothetical protein
MKIFITRRNYDTTTAYISKWSEEIIEFARKKGHSVIDFRNEKVCKEGVEKLLKTQEIDFVVFNGHGNDTSILGDKNQPIIIAKENDYLLRDKIVYSRTCSSANVLGRKAVENGCKAFIGYRMPFIFVVNSFKECTPEKDELAAPFKETSNIIPISILKGNRVFEAVEKSRNKTKELIAKYSVAEAEPYSKLIVFCLQFNLLSLDVIGNVEARG